MVMSTDTIPEWRVNDRFRRAVEHGHVSKQDLAAECGVSVDTIYNWISGRSRPRRSALKELARMSGVSLTWLETGREQGGDRSSWTLSRPGRRRRDSRRP